MGYAKFLVLAVALLLGALSVASAPFAACSRSAEGIVHHSAASVASPMIDCADHKSAPDDISLQCKLACSTLLPALEGRAVTHVHEVVQQAQQFVFPDAAPAGIVLNIPTPPPNLV